MNVRGQIKITGENGTRLTATVISVFLPTMHRFLRDELSSSGGTAPTVHRMACHVFEQIPQATRILYLSTVKRTKSGNICGVVLFLIEIAHQWWDIEMKRCEVEITKTISSR